LIAEPFVSIVSHVTACWTFTVSDFPSTTITSLIFIHHGTSFYRINYFHVVIISKIGKKNRLYLPLIDKYNRLLFVNLILSHVLAFFRNLMPLGDLVRER